MVSGATDILGWPRQIYLLEIGKESQPSHDQDNQIAGPGLSLLELGTALCCLVLSCRACCCLSSQKPASSNLATRQLTEEEKWEMVVQEYNEYRK